MIVDGKIMYKNLKKIGKDYKWLEKQIKNFAAKPQEILLATIDGKNQIFCQKKGEKQSCTKK